MTSSGAVLPSLLPLLTVSAAILTSALGWWRPAVARWVAVVTLAAIAVLAAYALIVTLDDGPLVQPLGGWAAPLGIEYVLDPLSSLVALVVGVIATAAVAFPTRLGLGSEPGRGVPVHGVVLLLVSGLLAVLISGDLFHLFVGLEIYSIASYALVALGGSAAALASYRYLLFGTVASSLYLLGVGFVYFSTGTLDMATAAVELQALVGTPALAAASTLMVAGLAIKMAVFPLHVWLPDAHSQAPPAVAALLAAVQVKVAAYALIRVLFDVLPEEQITQELPLLELLTWFGVAGVVVGSVMAVRQRDIKRLLAHSTVAQLGYIAVGIGLANPLALTGALLHVVGHAVMKASLFLVVGGVLGAGGSKVLARWRGLGPRMRWTMGAFTLAAVSLVGLPPTIGFLSKWYLISGAVDGDAWVVAVVLAAASVLTLVYMLRIVEAIWFRPVDDPDDAPASDPRPGALVPMVGLAAATLALGLLGATVVDDVVGPIANSLVG